jgi:hypothetical protein
MTVRHVVTTLAGHCRGCGVRVRIVGTCYTRDARALRLYSAAAGNRDGKPFGRIRAETGEDSVVLMFRSLQAGGWTSIEQQVPIRGRHIVWAAAVRGFFATSTPTASTADIYDTGACCRASNDARAERRSWGNLYQYLDHFCAVGRQLRGCLIVLTSEPVFRSP